MNIILANATITNGNRGCTALAITILYILKQILTEASVKYTFYLPDTYQPKGKYIIKVGTEEIEYIACGYPNSRDRRSNIRMLIKALFNKNSDMTLFKNADFIFDIGQGDSFSDIYGVDRFNTIDWIHQLARKYKKPYCILPQTIGPYKNEDIKKRALLSIEKASKCMTRDKQSMDFVIQNVPRQQSVKEYIDVAFFLPFDEIKQDSNFTHIGLNISALLWNGGYTKDNQFELVCDYQALTRTIIDYFLQQPRTKVHLISHVVLPERDIENDYEVCYEIWREYHNTNLVLAPFALGPVEVKSYIAGMDFFIGARMHSTIAAFSSGVPVVPAAYSRKFNGLFVDTLQYPYIVDMKTMTNGEIMNIITDSLQQREEMKAIIKNRMNGIVSERGKALYSDLKEFMYL